LKENNQVICLDNLYTGSERNIKHLKDNSNFEFIKHDVEEFIDIPVDEIYNFACPASPVHYQRTPLRTIHTSYMGALNTLKLAHKYGAKFLQASTSEVYGDPLVHPQQETYWGNVNPIGKRSCYDEGKRIAETLIYEYNKELNLNTRIIRIFNTYGPRMAENDGRVVSNFIIQALKGEDITVYGDGGQTRSFCYVDDLLDGAVKMMNQEGFVGPVNLGNNVELPIIEFAQRIIALTNSNSKIIYEPLPSDDPTRRRPDLSLAMKKLNWKPVYDLEQGLKNTIEYFENKLKEKA
jgi:UDP-glucuronate decarboxylase